MRRLSPPRPSRHVKLLAIPIGLAIGWIAWHPRAIEDSRRSDLTSQNSARQTSISEDEATIRGLVARLNSTRAETRRAASQALNALVARWELLPPQQAKPGILHLANALAAHADGFNAPAARTAAELATRLLNWQVATHTQSQQLLVACDRVLHASLAKTGPSGARNNRVAFSDRPDRTDEAPLPAAQFVHTQIGAAPLPGGGLPIESLDNLHRADQSLREFAGDSVARPLTRGTQEIAAPNTVAADAVSAIPASAESVSKVQQPARAVAAASLTRVDGNGLLVQHMRALHDLDPAVAEAAAQALRKQGFSAIHLELAKQLTADDPQVRKQLAETLAGVPGIDAEVWLDWLAGDEEPQVRLAALTVMATTTDPRMLKRVSQLAREDEDPRIQELGERLSSAARSRH